MSCLFLDFRTYIKALSLNLSLASLVGAAVDALFQKGYNNCVGRVPQEKLFGSMHIVRL